MGLWHSIQASLFCWNYVPTNPRHPFSVYRAVNIEGHRVAACKLVRLTEETTDKDRKNVEKEMRVHAALKHVHVLEFLNAVVVELKHKLLYVPGIYMLLEFAGCGDLFDKIAADVGVDDEVAQLYFNQLVAGMVRHSLTSLDGKPYRVS